MPTWADLLPLVHDFWRRISLRVEARHRAGRLKQWLNLLRRAHPQAEEAFQRVRAVAHADAVERLLWPGSAGGADQGRAGLDNPCFGGAGR
jgi:tRNA-dihydrouridine synthase C